LLLALLRQPNVVVCQETGTPSASLSIAEPCDGLLSYLEGCDMNTQYDCCTQMTKIGFDFPFMCGSYDQFSVSTEGFLTFTELACDWDFDLNQPYIAPFYGDYELYLKREGGIGQYLFDLDQLKHYLAHPHEDFATVLELDANNKFLGQTHKKPIKVIEWSLVYYYDLKYVPVGTIQVWLFYNGTFGLVYHLMDANKIAEQTFFYVAFGIYHGDARVDYNFIVDEEHPEQRDYFKYSSAYLFHQPKDARLCQTAKYIGEKWVNPPNICFNPAREVPQSESESVEIFESQSESGSFGENVPSLPECHFSTFASGVVPTDLDLNRPVSKQNWSIGGGIAVSALVVIILIIMFFL